MRRVAIRGFVLCAVVILSVPLQCPAQDDPAFHSCTLNVGGGWTPRTPQDEHGLDAGWNFQAGGGIAVWSQRPTGHKWSVFITPNFLFDKMRVSPSALRQARNLNPTDIGLLEANSAKAKFYSTTIGPTVRSPDYYKGLSFYAFAGFGWFRRSLEFTGASGQGVLLQPSSPVVFGTGGNSGAYDAGFGINYRLGRSLMVYAEARRVHGLAVNNATTLLPLSVGLRW